MHMLRSKLLLNILRYLCLLLIIGLLTYWLLTIVAPPSTGWTDEVEWQPVQRLITKEDTTGTTSSDPADLYADGDHAASASPPAAQSTEDAYSSPSDGSPSDGLIGINTANASELQELPGIGPAKAAAILAYRNEHGPFSSVDELLEVKGIGEKTLQTLKPLVTLQ